MNLTRGLLLAALAGLSACLPSQLRVGSNSTAIRIQATAVDDDGRPLKHALVTVRSRDRIVLAKRFTDRDGRVSLLVPHQDYLEIEGQKENHCTRIYLYPEIPASNEIIVELELWEGSD